MAYCQQCGQYAGQDWSFCRECGAQLAPSADANSPPPASQQGRGVRSRGLVAGVVAVVMAAVVAMAVMVTRPWQATEAPVDSATPLAGPSTTGTPSTASTADADVSADFSDVFDDAADGVVHVDAISCDGGGTGTGFLYGDHVATAAHVVWDATTVALTIADTTVTGTIVGIDPQQDLALVEPDRPLNGHRFGFADDELRVGEPVAALGFPSGEGLTFTQGTVSGLDRSIRWADGSETASLIQTDAALNPGNSGGPLLNDAGLVAGVVVIKNLDAEGISYAVQAGVAESMLDQWASAPQPHTPVPCNEPVGPADETRVAPDTDDDLVQQVADTMTRYFTGINSGDYQLAWNQLSPASQERNPYEEFSAATSTSYDFNFRIRSSAQPQTDTVVLWLTFTSLQAPGYGPDGESCTDWSLDYELRRSDGRWRIDRVTPHDDSGHTPCG